MSARFNIYKLNLKSFRGTQMSPLFVLVSSCFRENVHVTCKMLSFLCNLDNFLLKNVIIFFFENQISKWRSFEKELFLTYFSHLLVTRETTQKFLQHIIPLTCIVYIINTCFAHPVDFFAFPVLQKLHLSCMVSLWYDSWCWFFFASSWSNQ